MIKKGARKELKDLHKKYEEMNTRDTLNKSNISVLIKSLPFDLFNLNHMVGLFELNLSNKSLKRLNDLVCCYLYHHQK